MSESGWLKRQLKLVNSEVTKWPEWVVNVRVPHHLNPSNSPKSGKDEIRGELSPIQKKQV
jgi:hypothetical protein